MITKEEYQRHRVKRGLRNDDGTGVMAGLTHVCNVHGYLIADGDKIPDKGRLTYRGIDIEDIVAGCEAEDRFGFEEVAWLLIFGKLPNRRQFDRMCKLLYDNRELPEYFPEDMIIKAPSKNIMNKLARSVLALYSYDDDPTTSLWRITCARASPSSPGCPPSCPTPTRSSAGTLTRRACSSTPTSRATAPPRPFLNALRPDRKFTREEAKLLDLCMVLHAEHGGGNNSTFTTRVLTSAARTSTPPSPRRWGR